MNHQRLVPKAFLFPVRRTFYTPPDTLTNIFSRIRLLAGGMARPLFMEAAAQNLPVCVLLMFVSEGDNIQNAVELGRVFDDRIDATINIIFFGHLCVSKLLLLLWSCSLQLLLTVSFCKDVHISIHTALSLSWMAIAGHLANVTIIDFPTRFLLIKIINQNEPKN